MSTKDIKDRRLTGIELMGVGAAALALSLGAYSLLAKWRDRLNDEVRALGPHLERVTAALETADSLYALRARDLANTKTAMTGLARKQKTYYEERLSLAEERRLLEKQLELLETRFSHEPGGKLRALRAERIHQEFAVGVPACWGGPPLPPMSSVVTAKEFYAHPERGKVEIKDGTLLWTPPQTGSVSRQDALGQYVVFTNTPLIIHLPPKDKAAHEGYPHCCMPLEKKSAKAAYDALFIGARVSVQQQTAPAPAPARQTRAEPRKSAAPGK